MKKKWWGWGLAEKNYDLENKPEFLPFLRKTLESDLDKKYDYVTLSSIKLPEPGIGNEITDKLKEICGADNVTSEHVERLTHAYGKSYRDLVRIRKGQIDSAPDLVVFPENHQQVMEIIKLAGQEKISLIPFGGGTSVVGGIEAVNLKKVICLDISRNMNKLLYLDQKSFLATFQAGILGPELEAQLNNAGYTLSHYPQSFEFSTLGGWAATRSAGQQSTRYGKIEKMITSLKLATPVGELETLKLPAKATGPDLNQIIIGSEGIYGVITEVTVKIHKIPEERDYRGYLFESFSDGERFIREMMHNYDVIPATVRLSDEAETKLLFKLSEKSHSAIKGKLSDLMKTYMKDVKGFSFENTSFLLLGFEGSREYVDYCNRKVAELIKHFKAVKLGKGIGDKWYESRFDLPYLRDSLLDLGVMVDTLETSTTWDNADNLYLSVQKALYDGIEEADSKGLVACHISHVYPEGVSLYYTFVSLQKEGKELEQWQAIKNKATEAIVFNQGAISHHHGIGHDHARWLPKEIGETGISIVKSIKEKLDSGNIMNPQNLIK